MGTVAKQSAWLLAFAQQNSFCVFSQVNRMTAAAKQALDDFENGVGSDADRSPSLRGAYGAVVGPNGVAYETLPLIFRYYSLFEANVFEKYVRYVVPVTALIQVFVFNFFKTKT